MGTVRDSVGHEMTFDLEACARMRVFAERLDVLSDDQRAQVEARMYPDICAGESCACAGVHVGVDYGGPDYTVQAEVRLEADGRVALVGLKKWPRTRIEEALGRGR